MALAVNVDATIDALESIMTNKRKYKSDVSEAIHSSAYAMFRIGTIDQATMREFDESCLDDLYLAEAQTRDLKAGRSRTYTQEEVEKRLELATVTSRRRLQERS